MSLRTTFSRSVLSALSAFSVTARSKRTRADARSDIHYEQAQSLAATAKATLFVNLINGAVIATVLSSGALSSVVGAGWFATLLIAMLLRQRLVARLPQDHDAEGVARWVRAYALSALLTGSIWGATGFTLFLDLDPSRKLVVVMVLAGMAAGAAATNSAYAKASLFFFAPALAPPLVYFAVGGTNVEIAMAFLVVVFCATLVKVARTMEASLVRSITSEKKLEDLSENLSAIANYTYGWESWLSDNGQLRWVNPSVERVTGYTPQDCQAMTAYPLPIVHPDDRERVAELMRRSATNRQTTQFTCRIIRKDGVERWIDVVRHPTSDSKGRPFGFRASVRDITEQVELTRQLEAQAQTDVLTGLYNRRQFMELCEREVSRAQRFNRPLSIAILDIDHFKSINDRRGHAAGDACLADFAHLCASHLRASDILARWGGEEFILLMPETDIHQANTICERLRALIEEMRVLVEQKAIRLTVSIGLAQLFAAEPIEAAIARADAALYEAKRKGRNRVVMDDAADLVVV